MEARLATNPFEALPKQRVGPHRRPVRSPRRPPTISPRASEASGLTFPSGPNWIHGTANNPILDLANDTGTVIHSWGERQAAFDSSGARLSEVQVSELSDAFWGIISDAFQISNDQHDEIPAGKSLWDFVKEQSRLKFTDDRPGVADGKRELLLQTAEEWGCFVGSPIQTQTLKFFWLEECVEGENPFVAGTYSKVLARIAAPALQGATIHFSRVVDQISSSDDKVTVHTKGFSADDFDEVIVTVPLGSMQQRQISFEPALPVRMLKAIDAISYGCLDKVYISFPSAFWETPATSHNGSVEATALRAGPNTTATTMPAHQADSSAESHFPGFSHFLEPQYAGSTNPQKWGQQVINLAALPRGCAHPTLLFYIFGDCAFHIGDLVAKTPPDAIPEALFDFFEPYYSKLPRFDPGRPECKPSGALATAWANDAFAGNGSYSCFRVGLERGDEDIEIMREGIPSQRLWFAGEHTAPFVALGTVTGAYWSGEGVAKRIAEAYGLA